jgi:hypothetical protein
LRSFRLARPPRHLQTLLPKRAPGAGLAGLGSKANILAALLKRIIWCAIYLPMELSLFQNKTVQDINPVFLIRKAPFSAEFYIPQDSRKSTVYSEKRFS